MSGQIRHPADRPLVFNTKDVIRVFDETGKKLDADTIYPDTIEDLQPRWETAKVAI